MNDANTLEIRREAEASAAHFPALLVEAQRVAQSVVIGSHGRRRAGPGETFWQHRPYAFGDAVSTIDWRQSARVADRLYVRENEWEIAEAVYLWRDPSPSLNFASSDNQPTKRRRADILATALAILLSQGGERVGVLGAGRRPFQGKRTPERILETIGLSDDVEKAPPRGADFPAGARIVMFSDFFTDENSIAESVAGFANAGVEGVLLQVVDPYEEEFPFSGRVRFETVGNTEQLVFGETASLRSGYKDIFAAHRETLKTIASSSGWTFIAHRTDRPAQTALMALYAALADKRGKAL